MPIPPHLVYMCVKIGIEKCSDINNKPSFGRAKLRIRVHWSRQMEAKRGNDRDRNGKESQMVCVLGRKGRILGSSS